MSDAAAYPLMRLKKINKTYGTTKVLTDMDIDIPKGKIVGLVGENGAGKTTLMKIIMGLEKADSGTMLKTNAPYAPIGSVKANAMGVGMVFQEQSLLPYLTVGQNIYLNNEGQFKTGPFVSWSKLNASAQALLDSFGMNHIKANKYVSDYSFANRQMVEIIRAFFVITHANQNGSAENSLLILDEPTSVLNENEIKVLFKNVRRITDAGNSAIFVSHRLDEVLELCDMIYVLKDGKKVCVLDKAEATQDILYSKMVGTSASEEYYQVSKQRTPDEEVLLEVKDLCLSGFFQNVSFKLHKGEVLSILGSVGSGKEHVCNVLTGVDSLTSGEFMVVGKPVSFKMPSQALAHGIMQIPANRRIEAQFDILSIRDNIIISELERVKKGGLIQKKKVEADVGHWIERLHIKCRDSAQMINNLSGGNAQKVIFARALASGASVIILNHPTRGVDVGAKAEIYEVIRDATHAGVGIVLLADTMEECIGLSNRILVMRDGTVQKEFGAEPNAKPEQVELIKYMV